MEWEASSNRTKPHLPQSVLRYCCEMFLNKSIVGDHIKCFTEHNRSCDGAGSDPCKFRANPSYRSDSGLLSAVWYDWAQFLYEEKRTSEHDVAPAQLLCFLDLTKSQTMKVDPQCTKGELYVVVRSFKEPPKPVRPSKIVTHGTLYDKFVAYPCDSIVGPVAVVRNETVPVTSNKFFVVGNRRHWLECFKKILRTYETEDNSNIDSDTSGEDGFCDSDNNEDREIGFNDDDTSGYDSSHTSADDERGDTGDNQESYAYNTDDVSEILDTSSSSRDSL